MACNPLFLMHANLKVLRHAGLKEANLLFNYYLLLQLSSTSDRSFCSIQLTHMCNYHMACHLECTKATELFPALLYMLLLWTQTDMLKIFILEQLSPHHDLQITQQ